MSQNPESCAEITSDGDAILFAFLSLTSQFWQMSHSSVSRWWVGVGPRRQQIMTGGSDCFSISCTLPILTYRSPCSKSGNLYRDWPLILDPIQGCWTGSVQNILAKSFLRWLQWWQPLVWNLLSPSGVGWSDYSTAEANYDKTSILIYCSRIFAAFKGVKMFQSAKHKSVIKEIQLEFKLYNCAKYEATWNESADLKAFLW